MSMIERNIRELYSLVEKSLYTHGIVSTAKMTLPKFLGIGAQKAGTTWLHQNLSQHPDLYLPKIKESHYFSSTFYGRFSQYTKLFEPASGRLAGEITPAYSILPEERIRFIKTLMPDIKLILLLRNPIERAWSQAMMYLVREPHLMGLPNRKFDELDDEEIFAFLKHPVCLERGNYPKIINTWLSVFPRKQMHIDFYDFIIQDPKALLSRIFYFLDVDSNIDWDALPFNTVIHRGIGQEMPLKFRDYLTNLYKVDIQQLSFQYGMPVTSWL